MPACGFSHGKPECFVISLPSNALSALSWIDSRFSGRATKKSTASEKKAAPKSFPVSRLVWSVKTTCSFVLQWKEFPGSEGSFTVLVSLCSP